jgi:hypothetical protein
MAGCRLVTMLVGSRGRVGLVTPTPNDHLPALFGWRPISRATWGVDVCPLDRGVGVNPGLSLRAETRLGVLSPQHQTAVYETYNQKSSWSPSWRWAEKVRDQLSKCAMQYIRDMYVAGDFFLQSAVSSAHWLQITAYITADALPQPHHGRCLATSRPMPCYLLQPIPATARTGSWSSATACSLSLPARSH